MMRCGTLITIFLSLLAITSAAGTAEELNYRGETQGEYEARMQWFREARFGLFVHWGPVSLLGTEIGWSRGGERPGQGGTGTVPIEIYDQLYRHYNPSMFDAEAVADVVAQSGARYITFITKHHDGFNMFDTQLSDYKITSTQSPFGRDVARELQQACERRGIKVIWYYSLGDWYHPDYYTEHHDRFTEYLFGQLEELLTDYAPAAGLWFDLWYPKFGQPDVQRVVDLVKEHAPLALLNDRFGLRGDYDTPEQRVGLYQRGRPWESCVTIGNQWAWKPQDDLKSAADCLRLLINCAGGDGNLLLNTAPMPDGRLEPRQVERLLEMGAWLQQFGDTIYGTRGGPYMPGDYGVTTCTGKLAYVHLLHPEDGEITLPPLPAVIQRASLLTGGDVEVIQNADGVTLSVGEEHRQPVDTIVTLELDQDAGSIEPIITAANTFAFNKPASASNWKRAQTENLDMNERMYSAAMAFDSLIDTAWTAEEHATAGWLEVDLGSPQRISQVVLREPQPGVINDYTLEYKTGDSYTVLYRGYELGQQAVVRFEGVEAQVIRLNILSADASPAIAEFYITGPKHHKDDAPPKTPFRKTGASQVRDQIRASGPDKAFTGDQYVGILGQGPLWIDVDLDAAQRVDGTRVASSYWMNVQHYSLQCRDGEAWRTLLDVDGEFPEDGWLHFEPVIASQFRLTVESTESKLFNIWTWEFRDSSAN